MGPSVDRDQTAAVEDTWVSAYTQLAWVLLTTGQDGSGQLAVYPAFDVDKSSAGIF